MTYRKFIILCPARSGSTLLQTSLNASPEIICFREPFNFAKDVIDYDVEGYESSEADRQLRENDFRAFLAQRIYCEHPAQIKAVGFKAMYNHLGFFPGLAEHLAEQQAIYVIQLRRQNYLRTFASLRIAETQNVWIDDRPPPQPKVRLPGPVRALTRRVQKALQGPPPREPLERAVVLTPDECRFYFDWAETNWRQYQEQFQSHPFYTVFYENLLRHQKRELDAIQSFLGVTPRELPTITQHQNPDPLYRLIRNYDELKREFSSTEFAVFFED
jgi:hypothetical protein